MSIQIKSLSILLVPFLAIAANFAQAQDTEGGTPIRVTATIHNDGSRTVMKTDPDNHTAEAVVYDQANKLKQKTVFTLDESGQAINGVVYSAKNIILYKLVYKHDAANRLLESDTYSPGDTLISRTVYRYDGSGKIAGSSTYDSHGGLLESSERPGPTPPKRRGSGQNH